MAKKTNKQQFRSVYFEKDSLNAEDRTVAVAFSSEEPYERFNSKYGGNYYEVLGHAPGEIDLSFLNSGRAPLLRDHDQTEQIGVILSVEISESRGRALVKLSQNEEGQEELTDIIDGIRQNISVGYFVEEEKVVGEKDGKKVVRATRWRPVEVSTVSIPADETVGVNRSAEEDEEITPITTPKEETKMENTEKTLNVEEITREARKSEQARVREINALGSKFGMTKQADEFVRSDKSAEDFRAYVLENMDLSEKTKAVKAESADLGLTEKEVKSYSFVRAIRSQVDPREGGFEQEVSREAAKKAGVTPRGLYVPYEILTRGLEAGGSTNGQNFVANTVSGSFIELLRSKMVLSSLGATYLTGLVGNLAIPRQLTGATAYWVAEATAPTVSVQTMDQLALTPRTVGTYTDYSRKLLLQSSVDVENFVRNDLAQVLALSIESKALYGNTAAAAAEPTGIKATTGINTIDVPANAPTWGNVVTMEAAVETYNALLGNLAYLAAPNVKGNMKAATVDAGSGRFVWEGNTVNGYRAEASSTVTAGDIFFGNWADLVIGMWGGIDLVTDPYALSTSGGVRVVALASVDVGVRHPRSFVYGV